jgi:opacity protein-like surface antigen
MKKILAAAAAALALCAWAAPGAAQSASVAGAFGKGRTHFLFTAGTGYAFDESYLVLGIGGSYYVMDGLNLGLHYEYWSGSDPKLSKLTQSIQYVFHQVPTVKPYVGAFYRRTYIDGLDDLDSAGARAGAYIQAGRNAYIGAGIVYESYIDCTEGVYRKCDSTYGELSFTIAF